LSFWGLLFWGLDALVDSFLFYEGSLGGLLLTDVPRIEIFARFFILLCFTIFGLAFLPRPYRPSELIALVRNIG